MRIRRALFPILLLSGLAGGCSKSSKAEPGATESAVASTSGAASASGEPLTIDSVGSLGGLSAASAASAVAPPVLFEREDLPDLDFLGATLMEQRKALLHRMVFLGVIDERQAELMAVIMNRSKMTGQGNPEVTTHPMTRAECFDRRHKAKVRDAVEPKCGAPYMVPIWDPAKGGKETARVCIDRYEFPGLPCEYPLTWVTAAAANDLCKVMGKRLCDAHEWEGACAGAVLPVESEYAFGSERQVMKGVHDSKREIRWAYGLKKDHSKCGTDSTKSKDCVASGFKTCGSNTYPAGSFPECVSPFGVYDQHGNAAEHMLLPMRKEQVGQQKGIGLAEMKGSWFIFKKYEAHTDDCRWRSVPWHADEGLAHSNYHLGFRCCKDL